MRPGKKSSAEAEALGRSRGGFSSKLHGSVDAAGKPLGFRLTPGQTADITQAEELLAAHRPGAVLADKAYDSDVFVDLVRGLQAEVVIPPCHNRKAPRDIDRTLYKDRNKIERFFGRTGHYRRIATRYDKTARNYLAFIYLASIVTLLL